MDEADRRAVLEAHGIGRAQTNGQPETNGQLLEWPVMDPAAFKGIAGEVVDLLGPHTEADPVGILVAFLGQFGALVGAGPHIRLSGASHPPKIYAVLVGDSSSRKGAAYAMVRWVMNTAAPIVVPDRWTKGLVSGEGLMDLVRDPVYGPKGELVDAGVEDKRLYVFESEFTAVLEKMRRKGSVLSETIRDAWDSGDLRSLARHSPLRATGAHICILANATPEELEAKLGRSDVTNGFVNRFLFVAVKAGAPLPFGSEPTEGEIGLVAERIIQAVVRARLIRQVGFSSDAREYWPEIYRRLRADIPTGPLGHYVARADTHILRLALTYALADGRAEIGWGHMESALAAWTYCRASVELLLARGMAPASGRDEDVTLLLELLERHPDGMASGEAKAALGWNGTRLATTRARGERLRLVVTKDIRGEGRGRPQRRLQLP